MPVIRRNLVFRSLKIAGIYCVFGLLWILFSDQLLLLLIDDTQSLAQLQTIKGWFFIVVTAVLLFFLVRHDLSIQAGVEFSLRQSEERFRSLLNNIPDLIWLKDADGVYLSCNATFERFFGTGAAEIVGKTDHDFVSKELADFFREHDRRAMGAGRPCSNEEWITFADSGERALLLTTKVPMYDADGEIIGILGVGRDISALRKAEEERLKLESQLHQAKKIESIGQLAGGVAHDFNNMLGVIIGRAEMALRRAKRSEPVIADLEEISKASKRSAELTRQLLTFARQQAIVPQVLNINETITGMLKMLQRLIGENIHLNWNPEPRLWAVKIDPSQVDQILANLCVNARDAIKGNGNIVINTVNAEIDEKYCLEHPYVHEAGDYVRISVADDGCGIVEEVQDHIFEPFYTTKSIGSGTGLGLATVYGAVKQNNGFITFATEPGHGTVFNIHLPRVTDALPPIMSEKSDHPGVGGNETILLVEDDPMLLQLSRTMLEECGYRVLAVPAADAALTQAGEYVGPIHLLLTDLIMPGMNGKVLSEKLKIIRPELKVLIMSGYAADIIGRHGVIQDGIHFLQKPVSFETLNQKVRDVLEDRLT